MTEIKLPSGVLPDPEDPRDKDYIWSLPDVMEELRKKVPSEFPQLGHEFRPGFILDQGKSQKCVGYGGRHLLDIWEKVFRDILGNKMYNLSPNFLYEASRHVYGQKNLPVPKEGSCHRFLMLALRDLTVIERFHPIDKTSSNFINVLKAGIVIAWAVPLSLFNINWANARNLYHDSAQRNAHFVIATGYDEDRIQILNSWGPDWGQNGYAWIEADEVKKAHPNASIPVVNLLYNI